MDLRHATPPARSTGACTETGLFDVFALLEQRVPLQRRLLHAGDAPCRAGEPFSSLHLVHSGCFKVVNITADGREQVVALQFKGDWLGFDGIAAGRHACEAIAMDTSEVWSIRYDTLLQAGVDCPALLALLHGAMSQAITRDRESLLSLCTLPADARVAEFLRHWADSLGQCGLRTDQITLRMTRAEIGSYLGMTLESVSRALSRLAREGHIRFTERGRRHLHIASTEALAGFVQRLLEPRAAGVLL
ncbi:helix-turn-helix domain-containing protein [Aquincola sp. MAHUQ-54]|uniref:Helix-turn-helix domain-containing protein n=1 Tax=Aquincola agrisoli TaxID=3119538 RepID=A0AAW9Q0A7_9BURK